MSIEAISWALNTADIPSDRRDASTLAIVLVGLANHADPEGRYAFPSIAKLARYTRLSERSVQNSLRTLQSLNLITPSDRGIVAAYIKRADRRPNGWDLVIHKPIHSNPDEVQRLHPADQHGVQTRHHGVHTTTSRGADTAPEPSFNHPQNRPAGDRAHQRPSPTEPLPVCGQCDARDTDPISARVIWLDADRQHSRLCTQCHPAALTTRGTP
jgi:hypothetical protein